MSPVEPFSPHPVPQISRRSLLGAGTLLLAFQGSRLRGSAAPLGVETAPHSCVAVSRIAYPPMLERFVAKLDPALDDFLIERYAAEIEAILEQWSAALLRNANNAEELGARLAAQLVASSLEPSEVRPLRKSGNLRIERHLFNAPEVSGRDEFLHQWAKSFASFGSLQVAEMELYGVRAEEGSTLRLETEIRCDFVGSRKDGSREQRVGSWTISWERNGQSPWMVSRWQVHAEVRSQLTGKAFTDITGAALDPHGPGMQQLAKGIDYWRTVLDAACGIDVYGNHGLAVGDIDGNGFDSFYVCQPSGLPNRLYRNRGDGTFEDITAASGTGILDGTASAIFADFLNRGKQDLLVVRTGGPLLFASLGDGKFEPRPDAFAFARPPQGTFTSAAVADYNRDGLLDVYFCVYSYYQGLSQYQFPSPYYDAQNGPPNFLFRNRGDGTFEDVTVASGMDQNNNRFSFAAAWCDYDNDGNPDLYVANDFGRKNLYRNNGGHFTDVAGQLGVEDYGPGMSACWLDYDNDGLQDLYVANMWLKEGKRITADSHFLPQSSEPVRALYRKHNAGNSLYRNRQGASFADRSQEAGTSMARWSWSCASWDVTNEGLADLYIANGFVSGPNPFDLQSFFWRQVAQRSLSPGGAATEYEMAWNAVNELVRSDYSWSGYQRNVFYANNDDGAFSDISGVLGLDFRDDSRAFALSDFDGDGRLEFVLKNRTGPQLRLLRNDLESVGNSVGFRLRGVSSNRDAIGASVTIEEGATRQTRFISAGSGFASQHTKQLFFGVGAAQSISVLVRWPSGRVDHYRHIPVNHSIEIEEGSQAFSAKAYRPAFHPESSPILAHPFPDRVSTWLVAPLTGPDSTLTDLKGGSHKLSELHGQVSLLAFVRLGCDNSREQIRRLQEAIPELLAAAIHVCAVGIEADPAAMQEFAHLERPGVRLLLADERAAGAWNVLYRYLFDRRREMPMPVSFLLNSGGAIVRVYQGVTSPSNVVRDQASAPSTQQQRLAKALPLPGPWYGSALGHNYFTFGVAYSEYGYVDEAEAAFRRATEDNPVYAAAWFNLGTLYLDKKMFQDARRCLEQTVKLTPEDADAWNNLGKISGEEQKYDQALDEFRRAALANPNNLLPVQNMMGIYQYQGRPAAAQKLLEELIAKAPGNAELHLGLARTLIAQAHIDQGCREFEAVLRLRPGDPNALNDLGAALLKLGRVADALARFEESRRSAPDFNRPSINAAMVYQRMGQAEKGSQLLTDFLARHPGDADVQNALTGMGAK